MIARGKGDRRELSHPFEFEGAAVRVVKIDGEPWFVAKDVADVLGYRATNDLTKWMDEDERGAKTVRTPSGNQEMTIINESGLYSAILKSRKPGAKRFKKWVTGTVLPAIRKDGAYVMGEETPPSFQAWAPVRSPSRSSRPAARRRGTVGGNCGERGTNPEQTHQAPPPFPGRRKRPHQHARAKRRQREPLTRRHTGTAG